MTSGEVTAWVDSSNRSQAQAWDGDEGLYWATHSEQLEESLARYQPALSGAAAILPRHRVLDVTGDLALIGHPIEAHVTANHACHALNHTLVAALMEDRSAWELV